MRAVCLSRRWRSRPRPLLPSLTLIKAEIGVDERVSLIEPPGDLLTSERLGTPATAPGIIAGA
jgi:hypothetical protein